MVDGQQELENVAILNGERALAIDVVKTQGSNTIEVARGVRKAVAELQKALPPDVKLDIVRDSSRGIQNSVNNVQRTMVEGGLLTIAIVFLFLHSWRSTVITGLALPISVFGAFMVMAAFGFTLNVLTLMALSLAIGILIDDAIVVRENIMRHIGFGKTHRQAAIDGTNEIGLAVLATTFCIVAVFLPVGFMGGIIGRFFHQFGVMVSAAVLISLFVSFTLDPMLSSRVVRPAGPRRRPLRPHRQRQPGSRRAHLPRHPGLGAALAQDHAADRARRPSSAASPCPSTSASSSCPRPTSASRW